MSTRVKTLIAVGLLCMVGGWPPIHRALVWRFELNPWEFFGWAMYAAPRPTAHHWRGRRPAAIISR